MEATGVPPDLLTVLPNPEFPRKSHDLICAAPNTLPSVIIEQGCPNLRQNDPQRPPPHMPVEPAEATAVFSFRGWKPGSLPAISYQTYRMTEAAQVLAAIIHPYCMDPGGLVGMQHTFQGNFFLLCFCFKLALPSAATSWVSCLLAGASGRSWPLSDLLLPSAQPATLIQLRWRGCRPRGRVFLRESALISDGQAGGGG